MRVNFDATPELADLLEFLQQQTRSTKKDVLVGALQLLKWVYDQKSEGRIVAALDAVPNPGIVREYESQLLLQGCAHSRRGRT
jgi:hypothetical protein